MTDAELKAANDLLRRILSADEYPGSVIGEAERSRSFRDAIRAHLAASKPAPCPECGDSGEIVLGEPEGRHERVACMHPSHDSKPAPEAGGCMACQRVAWGWTSVDQESHTCTPAPPAVCEACDQDRQWPGLPNHVIHTCKPSGA